MKILEDSCKKHDAYDMSFKEAFEEFINLNNRTAVGLASYCDEFFRKEIKILNEPEIERRLDKILTIFRYIQDKDMFETYYKNSSQNDF